MDRVGSAGRYLGTTREGPDVPASRRAGRRRARRARIATLPAALLCVLSLVLAACGGAAPTAPSSGAKAITGGTASYAMPNGDDFSWMFPLENQANFEPYDMWVENEMWRPLYYPGGPGRTGIDYGISLAGTPVYNSSGTAVTVTMRRGYRWSDGTPVTVSDVRFFFQLEAAGVKLGKYAPYVPGEMPNDISSVTYSGSYTFTIHMKRPYNPVWFTGNQLTWIYALPAQAWDRTCATCKAGNAAATPSGAEAVYNFLYGQSSKLSTYATNPIWKVVDGPWVIKSYNPTTYHTVLSANPAYSGPGKPHLRSLGIYSFSSNTAELDALRSGIITYGWLPLSAFASRRTYESMGYTFKPWYAFYNDATEFGYTSKQWGPLVRQLYIRQALQHLVDQPLYMKTALHGFAVPDYGLAPDVSSPYTAPALRHDPYPYSVSAARALLAAHGWVKGPSGVDVCQRPGTAVNECGAGIAGGRALSILYVYETGSPSWLAIVEAFTTAAKSAGFGITLDGQTTSTMYSDIATCPPGPCNYGMAGWYPFFWDYGQNAVVPSGGQQLGKGNYWGGGYDSTTANNLIFDSHTRLGFAPLYADEKYISQQVALLWFPLPAQALLLVKNNLAGWNPLNPYVLPMPSRWYYVKG